MNELFKCYVISLNLMWTFSCFILLLEVHSCGHCVLGEWVDTSFFFILLHLFGLETIFGYDSSSHYTWNSPLKSRTLQVRCRKLSTHHVWEFGEQTGSEKNILLKQFPTPDMSCSAERKACQVSESNRASKNPTWNVEAVYNNLLDLSSFPLKSIHQPSICNTFHQ